MNPQSELNRLPDLEAIDHTALIVKAGIWAIPVFGSPAAELFGAVTAQVLGRRRDDWFEELRLRVNDLTRTVNGLT